MSLQSLIDTVVNELGLPEPIGYGANSTLWTSDGGSKVNRIRQFVYRAAKLALDGAHWAELRNEGTITLASGQATYALPTDFHSWIYETEWDRTNDWPLIGPISPQEWQARVSGSITTIPRKTYTVRGRTSKEIVIYPTPAAGDDGALLYYEYQSNQWFLPILWVTSTSYSTGDYVSYEGNIYVSGTTATSGATPPTHTSGSASDGAVTWTWVNPGTIPSSNADDQRLPAFRTGDDIILIDEDFIAAGAVWLYNRSRGVEYREQRADWYQDLKRLPLKKRGAKSLDLTGGVRNPFLSRANLPETGYGS